MKDTYTISTSGVASFISCPRRYNYASVLGYRARNPSPYQRKANRGTLIHKFLELYYLGIIEGTPRSELALKIAPFVRADVLNYPVDDLDVIMNVLFDYTKYYEADRWKPLLVERPFSILLYENDDYRILFEGRTDLLATVESGQNLVVDHKSTERQEQIPRHDLQLMGYSLATQLTVVVVNEIDLRKNLKPHERFSRYSRSYSKKKLAEFQQWLTAWAIQMVESERNNTFAPGYPSCKYCQFEQVCSQEPGPGRDFHLDLHFKVTPKFDLFAKEEKVDLDEAQV